jgi:hypothetical protein
MAIASNTGEKMISRRLTLGSLAAFGAMTQYGIARAARPFEPPGTLLDAAKKDAGLVLYTARPAVN